MARIENPYAYRSKESIPTNNLSFIWCCSLRTLIQLLLGSVVFVFFILTITSHDKHPQQEYRNKLRSNVVEKMKTIHSIKVIESNKMTVTVPKIKPISHPTFKPTFLPTLKPTPIPTSKPTVSPTESPTCIPTNKPSFKPTQIPSLKPILNPTKKPTKKPTAKPTFQPTLKINQVPPSLLEQLAHEKQISLQKQPPLASVPIGPSDDIKCPINGEDPFESIPVDSFIPPLAAAANVKSKWTSAQQAMVAKLSRYI